jgi:catechol 2,3-dioxygenase-like lactoylglutathione lyase family enzyme
VTCYEFGNDFHGITIKSTEIIRRATEQKYPITYENCVNVLYAPDGHTFYVIDEPQPTEFDPVFKVALKITNLEKSIAYWNDILEMQLIEKSVAHAVLAYDDTQAKLELIALDEPMNRGKAYGRIAFAIPYDQQPTIDAKVTAINGTILIPIISLDTPGKPTVRIIVLADPDGHEILIYLLGYANNLDTFGFYNLCLDDDSNQYKHFFTVFDTVNIRKLTNLKLHFLCLVCADVFITEFLKIKNLKLRSFTIVIWWIWKDEVYKRSLFRQFILKLQTLVELTIDELNEDQLSLICQHLVNLRSLNCRLGNDQAIQVTFCI